MSDKPKSFGDLDAKELYRSAIEDFAIPVDEADKNKKRVLLAAFAEDGVTWAQYVQCHPEYFDEAEHAEQQLKDQLAAGAVITSNAPAHGDVAEKPQTGSITVNDAIVEATVAPQVVVAQPVVSATAATPYLIKMVRENPLFEIAGYSFSAEHPYALVDDPAAAERILSEDGFRQAKPSELQEFYG